MFLNSKCTETRTTCSGYTKHRTGRSSRVMHGKVAAVRGLTHGYEMRPTPEHGRKPATKQGRKEGSRDGSHGKARQAGVYRKAELRSC